MPIHSLTRRSALASLAAGAGLLAAPRLGRGQQARPLRFVAQADLTILDPVWTPGIVSRNHGLMVFDTLYGVDAALRPQPQGGYVTLGYGTDGKQQRRYFSAKTQAEAREKLQALVAERNAGCVT